jgi:Thioredoxin-like [2Fe-2S] ferredoxin
MTIVDRSQCISPGDGMVDMTVLEAVAARCRSSSLLLGTSRTVEISHPSGGRFFCLLSQSFYTRYMQAKTIKVCTGRSCSERFSSFVMSRLERDRDFYSYPEELVIESCLCQGRCKEGPTVVFDNDVQVYMNPIKASEMLRRKVGEWKNREKKTIANSDSK